jgi:hypothetical protein
VVYVEAEGARDGSLAAVTRTRSLNTRRTIASESNGVYRAPASLPGGNLLVSFRPVTGDSTDTFGLYRLDPAAGRRPVLVFDDPDWHELDAVVVRPRTEPPGRSTVVDETTNVGQVCCLNTYITEANEWRALERGTVARVRVIASRPVPRTDTGDSGLEAGGEVAREVNEAVVLGEASVESDGSFFLDVPARTPLRVETLDGSGNVLQAMDSWFWVMPVERRGCIGCHEDREISPPNRHVLALRKPPQAVGVEPRAPVEGPRYPPGGSR